MQPIVFHFIIIYQMHFAKNLASPSLSLSLSHLFLFIMLCVLFTNITLQYKYHFCTFWQAPVFMIFFFCPHFPSCKQKQWRKVLITNIINNTDAHLKLELFWSYRFHCLSFSLYLAAFDFAP